MEHLERPRIPVELHNLVVQRLRHLALLEAEESLVLQFQESESRQSLERWPAGHVHLEQRVQTQCSSEPLKGLGKRESLLQCSVQTGPLLSAQQWHLVVHPVQRLVVQRHLSLSNHSCPTLRN